MKVGIRTPSVQKRVKARTTGRIKRELKGSINPLYGKKGMGYIKDPERAIKNKIYHKVTIDPVDAIKHQVSDSKENLYEREYIPEYVPEGSSSAEKFVKVAIICLLIYYLVRMILFFAGSGSFPGVSLALIIVLGIIYYRI